MFKIFIHMSGCTWNKDGYEFIFSRPVDIAELRKNLDDITCVQISDTGKKRVRVFGFINPENEIINEDYKLNEKSVKKTQVIKKQPVQSTEKFYSFPVLRKKPERFSQQWIDLLEMELRARKYSPSTRKAYILYNKLLCRTLQKIPEEIHGSDVTEFLSLMEKENKYTASALNLAISSFKFFYRNILKNDEISEQHRPHHDERLPVVLSKDEIAKMLNLERNPKHRLLLMLVYSSGLRVSEVVALKKEHIDIERKVIYIRNGKGRKDRNTMLADKAASFITEYCTFYGIETWLFPGQRSKHPLTIRSAQNIFDKALHRAQILKKISIHSMRHTFATHLLESGTDIRYIQSLLGHSSLRTTERYTHVAKRNVLNIKSPLDTIP
ncbi:MAG: site-specific integrase [Treponema sp.]|nr:site-specific integrase [Treponema sp.]